MELETGGVISVEMVNEVMKIGNKDSRILKGYADTGEPISGKTASSSFALPYVPWLHD